MKMHAVYIRFISILSHSDIGDDLYHSFSFSTSIECHFIKFVHLQEQVSAKALCVLRPLRAWQPKEAQGSLAMPGDQRRLVKVTITNWDAEDAVLEALAASLLQCQLS